METFTKKQLIDVAIIAAIMADTVLNELYSKMGSYFETTKALAQWSLEFNLKHTETDWEEVLFGEMTALSPNTQGPIISWDDAVMDYARHKLESVF